MLGTPKKNPTVEWLRQKIVSASLNALAAYKGLPAYLKLNDELRESKRYLEYKNFGEMGLAEIGISVRYSGAQLAALNTGRPLIIIGNHHLGIADGLALQYIAGAARPQPSLLFLARWIEKLLPHAVYSEENKWGTAIPVDINLPKESDPEYADKMLKVNSFNSSWSRKAAKALRGGAAVIIFPAGHVAGVNQGTSYPDGIYDKPNSWQEGFLNLARLGKADIVFAHVDSVNSNAFYEHRKMFGGLDRERVIWFFSEALAKKGKTIDVYLSNPMSLDHVYEILAQKHGHSREDLASKPSLALELMRQYTYNLAREFPQVLDVKDSPVKVSERSRAVSGP